MPDARYQYRGDLASTPLPEVLQSVHHYKVPGVVTARRGGVEKKIFVAHGDVIFATSGDRADSLGDYLLRHALITQEEFDKSVETLLFDGRGRRHGEVLVEMGAITEEALFRVVVEQVRAILQSVFDWEEGEFVFELGQHRTDEMIQLSIPIRQAVVEGVKAVRDAKRLVVILGPSFTVLEPTYKPDDIADVGLLPGEHRLLQKVDGTRTLKELVALGPGDPAHNARLLYAFHALRLVARKEKVIKKIQWRTDGGTYAPSE